MKKHWQLLQPDINSVEKICKILKCSPVTASILVNRKIVSEEDAFCFLNPSLNNMRPPFSIKDMDTAVGRIFTAITNNEKILIFGDYDVDGITATTILFEFFRYAGADVLYYIPHRIKEGYGLQTSHITDYALPNRINLIITADCGSGSHNAVKTAKQAGIDVIVTDHHEIPEKPPQAVAVVNPKRSDCTSGCDNLAGVGVAFYLLICLRKYLRDKDFWHKKPEPNLKSLCDLVALGTVADMVPLVSENRILVKTGLEIINSTSRPGIKALIEACKTIRPGRTADTEDIAFRLAPRLNAAGRIDHASSAVELLTTKNFETARQIAASLNSMNTKRQGIEKKILEEILIYLKENPHLLKKNTLVLSHHDWHEGILGIVASRIAKKFFRPVVLISTKDGVGTGSGRSIPGLDLYDALLNCSNDLERFGGHSMAAGLKIKTKNIDRFQQDFENSVQKMIHLMGDDLIPVISIDYELDFDDISDELIDELESLSPFGTGNHEPLFMARNVRVLSSKIVGKNHRRMTLKQAGSAKGKTFNAIHFNINTGKPIKENFDKLAFRLRWNRWNGKKTTQIIIEENTTS